MNRTVDFDGNNLLVDGDQLVLSYRIVFARFVRNVVVVLFDPDSNLQSFGQFANLCAIRMDGQNAWSAELPTAQTGDCYLAISSVDPLVARSFSGFACVIDESTGRIVRKEFTK